MVHFGLLFFIDGGLSTAVEIVGVADIVLDIIDAFELWGAGGCVLVAMQEVLKNLGFCLGFLSAFVEDQLNGFQEAFTCALII